MTLTDLPRGVRHLLNEYQSFERGLPLKEAKPQFHDMVRFNGNKGRPVHGWYAFKEGFSADLLSWVCRTAGIELDGLSSMLDPFCGAGTSLLSAQLGYRGKRTLHAYGIEHNPFIRFVAQAKLSWPQYRIPKIEDLIAKLSTACLPTRTEQYEVPKLSTIQDSRVFRPAVVQELLAFRHRIRDELGGEPEESFFLLGWAAIIEQASGVRKDGRALRLTEKRNTPPVSRLLRRQWESMLGDLKNLEREGVKPTNVVCRIIHADGRTLTPPDSEVEDKSQKIDGLGGKTFDLVVYSPPYLNNIDYSEVYKLELWLSGHIRTHQQFRELRLGSLRSHPSIKFPDTALVDDLPEDVWARRLRDSLLRSLPDNRDRTWRVRLVRGYVDDMYQALSTQFTVARPGATVVCVVGNSLHGGKEHPIPIATDLLISALGQTVGLEVALLQVARQLRRRDHSNRLLRESVIFMRRP